MLSRNVLISIRNLAGWISLLRRIRRSDSLFQKQETGAMLRFLKESLQFFRPSP